MQSIQIAVVSATSMAFAMVAWAGLARPFGLLDEPDGVRKHHEGIIPLVGGPALLTVLVLVGVLAPSEGYDWRFLLIAAATVLVGALDDRLDLSATLRLGIQLVIAALVVTLAGHSLTHLGELGGNGARLELTWAGPWFTVAALAAAMNAFNMLDGTDGQTAGIALVSLVGLIAAALLNGQSPAPVVIAVAACLPVFLVFNLVRAGGVIPKCFLGDSGALLLGLFVGCALVDGSQATEAIIKPVTVLWLAALPIFDTLFVMGYRALHKRSPLSADRNHVHHLLVDHGLTRRQALCVVLAGSSLAAVIGLALDFGGAPDLWSFLGVFAMFMLYVATALSLHRRRPEEPPVLAVRIAR